MHRSPLISSHPFPFLLYLEWALLGIAILTEVIPAPLFPTASRFPLLVLASLMLFGAIGLHLPTDRRPSTKVLYIILSFALILGATWAAGRGIRLYPFLYLILVIRGCLIFKMPGRLMVAGLTFACFLTTLLHRLRTFRPPWALEDRSLTLVSLTLNIALLFGLILVFVLLLVNALLAERESRNQLTQANDQLRKYAAQIETQATLQERN